MAKDPDARFPSAADMHAALLNAMQSVESAHAAIQADTLVESHPVTHPPEAPEALSGRHAVELERTEAAPTPPHAQRWHREPGERKQRSALLLGVPVVLLLGGVGLALAHVFGSSTHHTTAPPQITATHGPRSSATPRPRHTSTGGLATRATPARARTSQPSAAFAPRPTATETAAAASSGPPPAGGAQTPEAAVSGFYGDIARHAFVAARSLWTPRLQAECPPSSCINGNFMSTISVNLREDRTVSQSNGSATVQVDLTIYSATSASRYAGTWGLVHGQGGWLLDTHNLIREPIRPPSSPQAGDGHGNGDGNGNGNGKQGNGG